MRCEDRLSLTVERAQVFERKALQNGSRLDELKSKVYKAKQNPIVKLMMALHILDL